jgi:hypothetical protein
MMTARPVIFFRDFELEGEPGNFHAQRATGKFKVGTEDVELTLPIPKAVGDEKPSESYRRELTVIRDALTDIIGNRDGIVI